MVVTTSEKDIESRPDEIEVPAIPARAYPSSEGFDDLRKHVRARDPQRLVVGPDRLLIAARESRTKLRKSRDMTECVLYRGESIGPKDPIRVEYLVELAETRDREVGLVACLNLKQEEL